MKLTHGAHVAVLDGESFTMFRNTGKLFEPELEPIEKPELEPSNFSAGVHDQDQIGRMLGRTQLDELAHGAAAAEWLNSEVIAGRIEQLLVIADPKTLGEMRQHYHSELKKRLAGEIDKTLTGKTSEEIAGIIAAT